MRAIPSSGRGRSADIREQVEVNHAWKISLPAVELSDGSRLRSEGEVGLEPRTFSGQTFEAS
jgi:hypothetical protein